MIPHQNCEAKDANSLSPQPKSLYVYLITYNSLRTGRSGEETEEHSTRHDSYASSASLMISAFSGSDIVKVALRPNSCAMNRRANDAADPKEKKKVRGGVRSAKPRCSSICTYLYTCDVPETWISDITAT